MAARGGTEWGEFGPTRLTQGDQPSHFNLHTPVHIALFAHQSAQRGEFVGVAAVQRRQSSDGRVIHRLILGQGLLSTGECLWNPGRIAR